MAFYLALIPIQLQLSKYNSLHCTDSSIKPDVIWYIDLLIQFELWKKDCLYCTDSFVKHYVTGYIDVPIQFAL